MRWAKAVSKPRLELSQMASAFSIDSSSMRTGHHTLDSTFTSERMAAILVVCSQSLSAISSRPDLLHS